MGKDPGEDQERRCLSPEQPGDLSHQERRRDKQGGVDDAFNEIDGLRTIACPRGDERPRRDNEPSPVPVVMNVHAAITNN